MVAFQCVRETQMSNQPKITYRSDTTGCTYQMMQQNRDFTIQAVNIDGIVTSESELIRYSPGEWRNTIDHFFDIVTIHIIYGRW